jgi:aspartyl-tRNA(Asn)/glutamyl-tRNA(Gln) amidotransferase subunit B
MDAYEATIGLEVHVQLKTRTKAFCACAATFGAPPNTQTCPVCLGHPGTLPVLNGEALRLAARAAVALGCELADVVTFDRKNYFYVDLPKGFQISQHFGAVGLGGRVEYWNDDGFGAVALERVHLEEDVAKAVHDEAYVRPDETLLDFNRAGVPLMEVVSKPVITSAGKARRYIVALRQTLIEAGVSDCDLDKGAFRIDTNISVKHPGAAELGEQVEIKNLNSIRAMEDALAFEYDRQVAVLTAGGRVERQTRLFDEAAGETRAMRTKEVRADYRFFAEPDLPSVRITAAFIEDAREGLGSAPAIRIKELREVYAATSAEAEMIAFTPAYYKFLSGTAGRFGGERRQIVNWLVGDVTRELNERGIALGECRLTPEELAALLGLLDTGTINVGAVREVLAVLMSEGGDAAAIVEARGLGQISDPAAVDAFVREALAANPKAVADLKAGKEKAQGAIVGFVMKKTRGRANPEVVNASIAKLLNDV